MTPVEVGIMAGAIFFTSALTTATGVGGGSLLLALMLQFLTPGVAIPIHGALQSVANGWRIWLLREAMLWPIILRFGIPMPIGIAAGLWLFQALPKEWVQILIGGFILTTLFVQGLKSLRHLKMPQWVFIPAGFIIGVLNIIVGVVGPVLSTLLVGRCLSRQSLVNTTSVFSFLGHVLKVIGFALTGFSFTEHAIVIGAMAPSIFFGTYAGRYALGRISDEMFKKFLTGVLVCLAIKLAVWDGIMGGAL